MNAQSLADVLKTVPDTRFHANARLLTWHPKGLLADEIVGVIESEAFLDEDPFQCYTEFDGLTEIRLKIGHVFEIAERRRIAHEPVKSAFVARSVVGFGIARMYEELMRGGFIQVRAFHERAEAAAWLGVPLEILQTE